MLSASDKVKKSPSSLSKMAISVYIFVELDVSIIMCKLSKHYCITCGLYLALWCCNLPELDVSKRK